MFKKLVVLMCVLMAGVVAGATTYYVKSDGTTGNCTSWAQAGTVGTAMGVAVAGDSIWFKEGTYTSEGDAALALQENVLLYGGFAGTEGELEGRDWVSNQTILSGESERRCVEPAMNGYLDGFWLVYGRAQNGGAIYNRGDSYTLKNCILSGSSCYGDGGAIYNAGISEDNTGVLLTNVILTNNRASGSGGAIFNYEAHSVLKNCIMTGNHAQEDGGGMFSYYASPQLYNCTITNNYSRRGGALRLVQEASDGVMANIVNCILYGNNSSEQIYCSSTKPTVSYSCLEEGYDGTGNITDDPLFVEGELDGTLEGESPCIDAGTDEGEVPEDDLLGTARPEGEAYDMGAYEY